jgi:biopolymer transport protein ExbB
VRLGPALLVLCAASPAWAGDLSSALDQEIDVLQREKKQLEETLERAEKNTKAAKNAVAGDIERLTEQLVKLRAQNAEATEALPHDERLHYAEDQARQLVQLDEQIRTYADARGLQIGDGPPLVERVDAALARVRQRFRVHLDTNTEYFDAAGAPQRADVLRIGAVGAVTWTHPARPLVQVADGAWAEVPERANDVTAIGDISGVNLVLFDPREPPTVDRYVERTALDWVESGGFIMWPLLLLAAIGVVLIGERSLYLLRWRTTAAAFVRNPDAKTGDEHLDRLHDVFGGPAETAEDDAVDVLLRLKARLLRGLSFLALIAAVAPLLGLLGTVTGMIGTFAVITEHGTGDPRLLSGGISEALLTTQLGLMVAVPALLFHTGLHRAVGRLLGRIETAVVDRLKGSKS